MWSLAWRCAAGPPLNRRLALPRQAGERPAQRDESLETPLSAPSVTVAAAIESAARATGVSAHYLTAAARRESAFDPLAKATASSATGLFQFIEATWLETLSRHGPRLGLADAAAAAKAPAGRQAALALRLDPRAAALMAGALAQDNAASLEAALGRPPSAGELYAAHVLGAGDAARLFEAVNRNPASPAAPLFPAAARANPGLFAPGGVPASVSALAERLTGEADAAAPAPSPFAAPAPAEPRSARASPGGLVAPTPAPLILTAALVRILAALEAPARAKPVGERGA